MTDLIACLSVGKGTWKEVLSLIDSNEFENIYLVINSFVKERFTSSKPVNLIVIEPNKDMENIINTIYNSLKNRIRGFDVALNLNSGIGKEHMAILAALLRLGIGIRLVTWKDGIKEITSLSS